MFSQINIHYKTLTPRNSKDKKEQTFVQGETKTLKGCDF
nr:MAG TPA: hypothetical protein [Caudoviricetes sp.]